jgi:hypothetical protein
MNPTCTPSTLIASTGCLTGAVLTSHERQALKVYFMVAQLAAIGGTDYRALLSTTLITDTKCWAQNYNSDQRESLKLLIEENNANAAGAALSSDVNVQMGYIKCLKNVPANWLEAMEISLRCQLGRAKSYTQ